MPKPPPYSRDEREEYWWEGDPTPQGMITLSAVFSNFSDSPSSRGVRVSYGAMGPDPAPPPPYGWKEIWYSFQQTGDVNISSAGMTFAAAFPFGRLAVGIPFDLGFERRSDGDRHVLAGIIGIGAELDVRVFRRWDFVATAEQLYRTTVESELQGRIAIRFHHERLPVFPPLSTGLARAGTP